MKIGILVLMAGRNAGGPETYEVELIRSLAKLDQHNEYVVYSTGPEAVNAIGVRQDNFRYRVLQPGIRPVSLTLTLPLMLKLDGVDFLHCTFTPPMLQTTPLLFTVHCLSSIVHKEWYKPAKAMRLNYLLKQGIRSAELLTCVSQYTADHVREMFGVDRNRLLVAYNGVGSQFTVKPEREVRDQLADVIPAGPYMLYLGKIQAQKNIVRLLQAYEQFRFESCSQTRLVLAGRMQGDITGIEEQLQSMAYSKDVVRLGYVQNEVIPYLYGGARMFVYPSLWEGFGIPIIESMASGTPVITSKVTCLPEIAGGAALTVDPRSVAELAAAITRLDESSQERDRLRCEGLVRAKSFSWENCARATLGGYERMN
jgi:glycosyltransferase involved in cell wall biosynthesis